MNGRQTSNLPSLLRSTNESDSTNHGPSQPSSHLSQQPRFEHLHLAPPYQSQQPEPSPEPPQTRPSPAITRSARRQPLNKFACHRCQKKKTKCDGERPRCGACVKRREPGIDCEYPVRQGAVSRYSDLKQTFGKLERENREFRELFAYLRERPEHEAFEVYRRLRTTTDPLGTLQFVRDADALLAMPAANSCSLSDRRAAEIEAEALASSPIKVPSRPWTSVAGDGLVSNLVSSFFKWDHPFMIPFIDQELFVRDMRGGEGPHCSAFLVNAICTLRSIMSDTARQYKQITASDLTASFLSEAQMHREREAGKVSITTVQALYLLFLVSCCDGTNRAGSLFRFASLNMLQRLNPERVVARLNDDIPHEAEKKRALSRLLWGMFLVESIVSSAYLKPPPLSPPSFAFIPDRSGMHVHNLDVLGAPFTTNSVLPPLVPGSEQAAYQAGVLLYNVMMYNVHPRGTVGSEWDMRERRALFSRLGALENSMVPRLGYRENPVPQTLHLKTLMNMVAYNIIRPLHPSTVIQTGYTARTILLELCAIDVEIIETYERRWTLKEYSPMVLCSIWGVTLTLLPHLDDPRAPNLFTRGCAVLRTIMRDMKSVRIVMQGMLAMVWTTGQQIPASAMHYFAGLDSNRRELRDVPFEFSLPVPDQNHLLLSNDEFEEEKKLGADVAGLLQKWSALSVD